MRARDRQQLARALASLLENNEKLELDAEGLNGLVKQLLQVCAPSLDSCPISSFDQCGVSGQEGAVFMLLPPFVAAGQQPSRRPGGAGAGRPASEGNG